MRRRQTITVSGRQEGGGHRRRALGRSLQKALPWRAGLLSAPPPVETYVRALLQELEQLGVGNADRAANEGEVLELFNRYLPKLRQAIEEPRI